MDKRNCAIDLLKTVLHKERNIQMLENLVFTHTNKMHYLDTIYEITETLKASENKIETLKEIIEIIEKGNFSIWKLPRYKKSKIRLKSENKLYDNTLFDVEEGVLECGKCGGKKTISFQRQTRSADEGATTFVQCIQCGNRWRNSN